jgi:hypothetical protein
MDINYETVRMGYQILDLLVDRDGTMQRNMEEWSDIIPLPMAARIRLTIKLLDGHASGWTTSDADIAGFISSWILNICAVTKQDSLNIAKRMTGIVNKAYKNGEIDKKRYLALRALHRNFAAVIEWLDGLNVWTYVPISKFNNKILSISF